ncbi:MAG: hypothetical protein AVDCRST_MAG90-440, partial [uncultured Microvirga sp.]
ERHLRAQARGVVEPRRSADLRGHGAGHGRRLGAGGCALRFRKRLAAGRDGSDVPADGRLPRRALAELARLPSRERRPVHRGGERMQPAADPL